MCVESECSDPSRAPRAPRGTSRARALKPRSTALLTILALAQVRLREKGALGRSARTARTARWNMRENQKIPTQIPTQTALFAALRTRFRAPRAMRTSKAARSRLSLTLTRTCSIDSLAQVMLPSAAPSREQGEVSRVLSKEIPIQGLSLRLSSPSALRALCATH